MIERLYIQNYALIDKIQLEFGKGLNIITGETGAGKSIILGALTLILGKRADSSVIYKKQKKCVVEGVFSIDKYHLQDFFTNHSLDYDPELIIRRELSPNGKSRAFVNDTPVNLTILAELSKKLIDLHQQFDSLEIRDSSYQLHILDLVAGNEKILYEYQESYNAYKLNLGLLNEWVEKQKVSLKEQDYLQFLANEFEEASFQVQEQKQLESDLEKQNNLENITSVLFSLSTELDKNEESIISLLRQHINKLGSIQHLDQAFIELQNRLQQLLEELVDINIETDKLGHTYRERPDATEDIQERLDLIYKFQHKHQVDSMDALIEVRDEINQKLMQMQSFVEKIDSLKESLQLQEASLLEISRVLHQKRKSVVATIQSFISNQLEMMGIPYAQIVVKLVNLETFNKSGRTQVEFTFAANKGAELLPLRKVASGGEVSRLNLAIKSLIANKSELPSLIFDEIDSGISGEIAIKLGNILNILSSKHQIISITHSPQVAARASRHFFVFKEIDNGKTSTLIKVLTQNERIIEIAKMLSGDPPIPSALENAKELIRAT